MNKFGPADVLLEAVFAEVAYVNGLAPGKSPTALASFLEKSDVNLPRAIIEFVTSNFEIVDAIRSSWAQAPHGFDASIWRGLKGSAYEGRVYVALRGTQGLKDIVDDVGLALAGVPTDQTWAMAKWWLEATTPKTQSFSMSNVPGLSLIPGLSDFQRYAGRGTITMSELLSSDVRVVGHSLGGYLSAVFTRLFERGGYIDRTSTFNAAGLAPFAGAQTAWLEWQIGQGVGRFAPSDSDRYFNFFAANGINVTTNDLYFSQPGQRIPVFNDDGIGLPNHSISRLVNTLALGQLLETLCPDLTLARLNATLYRFPWDDGSTFAEGVEAMARFVNVAANTASMPDGFSEQEAKRELAFRSIDQMVARDGAGLLQNRLMRALGGNLVIGGDHDADLTRSDFASFLAASQRLPFSMSLRPSDDGTALQALGTTHAQGYARWQADLQAWRGGTDDHRLLATDAFLTDLCLFANASAQAHQRNWYVSRLEVVPTLTAVTDLVSGGYVEIVPNAAGVDQVRRIVLGSESAEDIAGDADADRLYGGGGADLLFGLGANDRLEGQDGNDTLDGGAGDDLLIGGDGLDTYAFNGGFGRDVVVDRDNSGVLKVDGVSLAPGQFVVSGVYRTADENAIYTVMDGGDGGQRDLVVSFTNRADRIVVRGWTGSGSMGVRFSGNAPLPATVRTLTGDFAKKVNGTSYVIDDDQNYVSDGPQPGATDLLWGDARADAIYALAGDDAVLGREGDDLIDGGAGSDVLQGGLGKDWLIGGAGHDILYGSSMGRMTGVGSTTSILVTPQPGEFTLGLGLNWYTFARFDADGALNSYITDTVRRDDGLGDVSNVIDAGDGMDTVYTGRANDIAHLGSQNDVAYGMAGADVIMGGYGRDKIHGDGRVDRPDKFIMDTAGEDHGADVLSGGAGDDIVFGQGHDDIVYGNAGADLLFGDDRDMLATPAEFHGQDLVAGGEGNDTVFGGAGNDDLRGDGDDDRLFGDGAEVGPASSSYISPSLHGADTLQGGSGADTLSGGAGDDLLQGGSGNDAVFGDAEQGLDPAHHGNDLLEGGDGSDVLWGHAGRDTLIGGSGRDALVGGDGADVLQGGQDADQMEGGAGDDLYIVEGSEPVSGQQFVVDSVIDQSGRDRVRLVGVVQDDVQVELRGGIVFVKTNDRGVGLIGGLTSSVAEIQFDDGQQSLRRLVHERLQDRASASSSRAEGVLLGGLADDALTVMGLDVGTEVWAGRGDDRISYARGGRTLLGFDRGDGQDTLEVRSAPLLAALADDTEVTEVMPGGPDVLQLGADISFDDLRLVWRSTGWHTLSLGRGDGLVFQGAGWTDPAALPAGTQPFDTIRLADGNSHTWDEIVARGVVVMPGATIEADDVTLTSVSDEYQALAGDDTVRSGAGDDLVQAGPGADQIWGEEDADHLLGHEGVDRLFGGTGADTLDGGAGDDTLVGDEGDDVGVGGDGDDRLELGAGGDTYRHSRGQDVAVDTGAGHDVYVYSKPAVSATWLRDGWVIDDDGGFDVLHLDGDWHVGDLTLRHNGRDLLLRVGPSSEIVMRNATGDGVELQSARLLDQLTLQDGTVVDASRYREWSLQSTAGDDHIVAYGDDEVLDGGAGDDRLDGGDGDDTLDGGNGHDDLHGGRGSDELGAGPGGGQLSGGLGDDLYVVGAGDGSVSIGAAGSGSEADAGVDVLRLAAAPDRVVTVFGKAWNMEGEVDEVILRWLDGSAEVRVRGVGLLQGGDLAVDRIEFADGAVTTLQALVAPQVASTGPGPDLVVATSFDETLRGGLGDDTLNASGGADLVEGEGGRDILQGGWGADTLVGGVGNDVLEGGAGDDVIRWSHGDGFDDAYLGVDGRGGVDTLAFGTGVSSTTTTVRWTEVVVRRIGPSLAQASATLVVDTGNGGVRAAVDQPSSYGEPTNWAIDRVVFAGGEVWSQEELAARAGRATPDADTLIAFGGTPVLDGLGGSDTLHGGQDGSTLLGGEGDDLLLGGGRDSMVGGTGDDQISLSDASTVVFGRGDGRDRIDNPFASALSLRFTAGLAVADLSLLRDRFGDGGSYTGDLVLSFGGGDSVRLQPGGLSTNLPVEVRWLDGTAWTQDDIARYAVVGNAGDDALMGFSDRDDVMVGGDGDDLMWGMLGDDTLSGGAGHDTLHANAGGDRSAGADDVDMLIGGRGDDRLVAGPGSVAYHHDLGDGHDTIAWASYDRFERTATLLLGAGIRPADVRLRRTAYGDLVIEAGIAGDRIDVEGYFDMSSAEPRASTYYRPLDRVQFADGTVWATDVLLARVESSPTEEADMITGKPTADSIDALSGDDVVHAGAGDDTIAGGAGADRLLGDHGSDRLAGGDGADTLDGGAHADDLDGEGDDDWLEGGQGADTLKGGTGRDSLYGGDADDVYAGGPGDDQLVDDSGMNTYRFRAGDGVDTLWGDRRAQIVFEDLRSTELEVLRGHAGSLATAELWLRHAMSGTAVNVAEYHLGGDWSAMKVQMADNVAWTPESMASRLAGAIGQDDDDRIILSGTATVAYGLGGADHLQGTGGANRLDGGAGRDTMVGGAGNDVYVVDDVGDVVTESSGGGVDTVQAGLSWVLGSQFENLVLLGSANLNGTGNTLANHLQGNDGANQLNGGSGGDTLVGAGGDDVYVVDSTADVVTELAGQGMDTVQASVNWTLGANLEHLVMSGTTALSATGNELSNRLVGNTAANRLTGGAGHDTLDGGLGSDTMVGGTGDDVYVVNVSTDLVQEAAQEGLDRVLSEITLTLGANVEYLTLTGTAALNGTGHTGDNHLVGNAAANLLTGLAGSDTLEGGAGNDTVVGGAGADRYVFGIGHGVDTVQENDSTAGVADRIEFGAGISAGQVVYARSGYDLLVQLKDTADRIVVKDWARGAAYRVESYAFANGEVTTDAQVQQLVGAMASFASTASAEPLVARTADVRWHDRWSVQPF